MMNISNKSEEVAGRTSLAYQDDSDDGQSLLSDDGREVANADRINPRGASELRKKTPWGRILGAFGFRRATDHLPYYALQPRGQPTRPKPRSRRRIGSCLRYFIAYVPSLIIHQTIPNDHP
jgi:hypothetical protein